MRSVSVLGFWPTGVSVARFLLSQRHPPSPGLTTRQNRRRAYEQAPELVRLLRESFRAVTA